MENEMKILSITPISKHWGRITLKNLNIAYTHTSDITTTDKDKIIVKYIQYEKPEDIN